MKRLPLPNSRGVHYRIGTRLKTMASVRGEEEEDTGSNSVGGRPYNSLYFKSTVRRLQGDLQYAKPGSEVILLYVCAHCAIRWTPFCEWSRAKERGTVLLIICRDIWHCDFLTEEDGVMTMCCEGNDGNCRR